MGKTMSSQRCPVFVDKHAHRNLQPMLLLCFPVHNHMCEKKCSKNMCTFPSRNLLVCRYTASSSAFRSFQILLQAKSSQQIVLGGTPVALNGAVLHEKFARQYIKKERMLMLIFRISTLAEARMPKY